jgi:uncharacterized protein (TIGR02594 family)
MIVMLFGQLMAVFAKAGDFDTRELRSVFMPNGKSSGKIELIRLYRTGEFEHLVYTPDLSLAASGGNAADRKFFGLQRNTGQYKLENGELTLTAENIRFRSEFYRKKLLLNNSKVYENRLKSVFKKDEYLLRSVSKAKYSQPFFLDPENARVVSNLETSDQLDLGQLVEFLKSEKNGSKEKIGSIWAFIRNNLILNVSANENERSFQDNFDIFTLLSGQKRTAGSFGFSYTFTTLLERAGFEARTVSGLARRSADEFTTHFWNAVSISGTYKMYDIAWGEEWKAIEPSLMIHTHFPNNTTEQFLDEPLSEEEFRQLAVVQPLRESVGLGDFFPKKGKIEVKKVFKMNYEGSAYPIKIEVFDLTGGQLTDVNPLRSISSGKVMLEIPISTSEARVSITLVNGCRIDYLVLNNGKLQSLPEEKNVYVSSPAAKRDTRQSTAGIAVQNKKSSETSTELKNTTVAISSAFTTDLQQFLTLPAIKLEHPLIKEALKYYGITELAGDEHNKTIVSFFKSSGNKNMKSDEDAWCSVFLSACARNAGLKFTNNALARSWLKVGTSIEDPQPGDVVVFWREAMDSYKGHVGIWLGETAEGVVCLGGNQDNSVCIRVYEKTNVLGYRRLPKK